MDIIKEIESYCDKQRIDVQVDERKDGTIEIAIDNFNDFEKEHIRDMLYDNCKVLESEYLAGNGWWWLINTRYKESARKSITESKKSARKSLKEKLSKEFADLLKQLINSVDELDEYGDIINLFSSSLWLKAFNVRDRAEEILKEHGLKI